jgi:RNA polymerase sigma-70 factor (ECF subfamily)
MDRLAGALDALPEDTAAEPVIRELVRAAGRLRLRCATLLYKSYPRLARPPVNLEADELCGGVVAGLLTALRRSGPRPCGGSSLWPTGTCAGSSMDLARRLDERSAAAALQESRILPPAPPLDGRRMLGTIEGLAEDEREVLDLIGNQELTHPEAAAVVGVSVKTVQRRLNRPGCCWRSGWPTFARPRLAMPCCRRVPPP